MINFYSLFAEQKLGVPAGWMCHAARVRDGANGAKFIEITGSVCTAKYMAGPRKGAINWSKRDRASERVFILAQDDIETFIAGVATASTPDRSWCRSG